MNRVQSSPAHHLKRGIIEFAATGRGLQAIAFTPLPSGPWGSAEASIAAFFESRYAAVQREIEFKPTWGNGTGYFDGAVRDPQLREQVAVGEVVKTSDEYNRKILIVGTHKGLVVVFPRYNDTLDPIVFNMPYEIKQAAGIGSATLTLHDLHLLLGTDHDLNIGQALQCLHDAASCELAG